MSKKQCNRNLISRYEKSWLKSQPLNQDQIWIIDSSPCRSFGDQELDMSKIIKLGIPISRYVKSQCNLSHQIKVESGPLIPFLVRVSGIESWICQRLLTSGISISWYVKSWYNLSIQIKDESRLLIPVHVRVSRIACWRCQRNNATRMSISRYAKLRFNCSRWIKIRSRSLI